MPEATVHEDGRSERLENNVGATREIASVEAISEAGGMESATDGELRLGVFAPDRGHRAAADAGDADLRQPNSPTTTRPGSGNSG
jgi:hypothetical protein